MPGSFIVTDCGAQALVVTTSTARHLPICATTWTDPPLAVIGIVPFAPVFRAPVGTVGHVAEPVVMGGSAPVTGKTETFGIGY
jgi:hypothetical protein